MGKKKSSAPVAKRPKLKVDTVFSCPACNKADSVTCEMDFNRKLGTVTCKNCKASYASDITQISEPIDVYSDWIDACEALHA